MSGRSIVSVDLRVNLSQNVARGHDSELLTRQLTVPLKRVLCFDEPRKLLALTTVERCVVHSTSGKVEYIDLLDKRELGLPEGASEVLPLLRASTAGEVTYTEGRGLTISSFVLLTGLALHTTSVLPLPKEPCYMPALRGVLEDGRTAFVRCSVSLGEVNRAAAVPLAVLEAELEMLQMEKVLYEDGTPGVQGRGIGGPIKDDGSVHLESPLKYSQTKGELRPASVLFFGTQCMLNRSCEATNMTPDPS